MSARTRAYLMMLAVTVIWGVAGPVIKYTENFFDPVIFLTYRFFISSLILIPILFWNSRHLLHKLPDLSPREWLFLGLASLVGSSIQLGLLFWGFSLTNSFNGTLIGSTAPIFTALAGFWFLKEHVTIREKWGIGLAFLGSLVIIAQPAFRSGKLLSGSTAGNLIILVATIFVAVHAILIKINLRTNLSPLLLTTAMFFVGFVSMSAIALVFKSPSAISHELFAAPLSAHLGVFYMALFSGCLAYWFFHKAQKTIEVSEANLFVYLQPVFAAPLSFFWLHESMSLFLILGAAIVATGVLIAEIKPHL